MTIILNYIYIYIYSSSTMIIFLYFNAANEKRGLDILVYSLSMLLLNIHILFAYIYVELLTFVAGNYVLRVLSLDVGTYFWQLIL